MTVAAGIGRGAVGVAESLAPARASGGSTAPAGALTAESFRSGWQSLLATLGSGFGGLQEAQTGTGETPAATATPWPEIAENAPRDEADKAAIALGFSGNGQGSAAVATAAAPNGSGAQSVAAKAAPGWKQPALAEVAEKGCAKGRATESVAGKPRIANRASDKTTAHAAAGQTTVVPDLTSQSLPVPVHQVEPSRSGAPPQALQTAASIDSGAGGALQATPVKIATQVAAISEKSLAVHGPMQRDCEAATGSAGDGTSVSQQISSLGESNASSQQSAEHLGTSGEEKAASIGENLPQAATVRAASENDPAVWASKNDQTRNLGMEAAAGTAGGDGPNALPTAVVATRPESTFVASPASKNPGSELAEARNLTRPVHATGSVEQGTHQALSGAGDSGLTAQAKEASGIRETFAALDAEPVTPTWVHASAHRAEAGFQDPALGWVGVRADSSGGSVHAALVPGSADAAQTLAGHLAGLNAYLADHHTAVDAVTVAPSEDRSAGYDMGQNMNQGAGQGGAADRQSTPETPAPTFAAAVSSTSAARTELPSIAGNSGGAHISVMA